MRRAFAPLQGLLLLAGALVLSLAGFSAMAEDLLPVPKLTGRVVDRSGTLTVQEMVALETKLTEFEKSKGSQVVVLIVPFLNANETIEDFAGRVTDDWKLGRKGVDDGVLFVIVKQARKMRIHNGRGVQGVMTDALSKRILAEIVAPAFRTGDFAGGINGGVDAITKAIQGEDLPPPTFRKSQGTRGGGVSNMEFNGFFLAAIFAVPLVSMLLRKLVGRLFGAGLTGAATGVAGWLLFGSLIAGGVIALIAFVMAMATGSNMLRQGRSSGGGAWIPSGGGWSSGGGGGWSSGGSDSFSGGGGGFDGGGSSGDW